MCYHVRAFAFLSFPEAPIARSKCLADTINHTPPCRIRHTRSVLQTCSSLPSWTAHPLLGSSPPTTTRPSHGDSILIPRPPTKFLLPTHNCVPFPTVFSVFGPPSPPALYHRSFTLHTACPRVLGSRKHGPGLNHLCARGQRFAPSDAERMFPD